MAIYDEEASAELHKTQEALELEGVKQDSSVYRWVYRPEMQYSVFELDIENIQAIDIDEGDDETVRELTDSDTPVIAGDDDALRIKQNLFGFEYDALSLFGSDESLLLSLETYEQSINPTQNGEPSPDWNFRDLGHLGELNSEDFLSLNLLKNNDEGNVLWEWAFEYLALDTQFAALDTSQTQKIYVSADEPVIPLQVELVGYSQRSEQRKKPVPIRWSATGSGEFDESVQQINEEGVAFNQFTVSTIANNRSSISVSLLSDLSSKNTIGEFITIPGIPASVKANISGEAYVAEGGSMTVEVIVKDGRGNLVADDTSVNLSVTGSATLNNFEPGTVKGKVAAEILGGMYPGDYELIVNVANTPEQRLPFTVKPYIVSIEDLPTRLRIGQSGDFTLKAVEQSGQAAPEGTAFQLIAAGLIIDQTSAVAGANGEAKVQYRAGYASTDMQVRASVGYATGVTQDVAIRNNAVDGPTPVDVQQRVLVGNRSGDGTVDFERYDGVVLGLPYATELNVSLTGEPGENIALRLGTPERPNVEPLVAFTMSDEGDVDKTSVGTDAMGLHHSVVKSTAANANELIQPQRRNHYRQQPGDSLVFDGMSYLESTLPTAKINPTALGFRVDAYVDEQSSGEVLSLAGDLLSLRLQSDGSLRLRIKEALSDGTSVSKSLDTQALTPGWHTIAGVYDDGELSLYLDTGLQWSEQIAALALPQDEDGNMLANAALRIGQSFNGALDNLELYDPTSPQLLRLGDGDSNADTFSVTLDNTGNGNIMVQSTGQMNQANATFLAQRSVLLSSDAGTEDFINLLALDAYTALAGVYATTVYKGDEVPAIDDAALDSAAWQAPGGRLRTVAAVGDFFVSPAHAIFGFNKSRFFSGLANIASLVLPINEIK